MSQWMSALAAWETPRSTTETPRTPRTPRNATETPRGIAATPRSVGNVAGVASRRGPATRELMAAASTGDLRMRQWRGQSSEWHTTPSAYGTRWKTSASAYGAGWHIVPRPEHETPRAYTRATMLHEMFRAGQERPERAAGVNGAAINAHITHPPQAFARMIRAQQRDATSDAQAVLERGATRVPAMTAIGPAEAWAPPSRSRAPVVPDTFVPVESAPSRPQPSTTTAETLAETPPTLTPAPTASVGLWSLEQSLDAASAHPPFRQGPTQATPPPPPPGPERLPWNASGKRELFHSYVPTAHTYTLTLHHSVPALCTLHCMVSCTLLTVRRVHACGMRVACMCATCGCCRYVPPTPDFSHMAGINPQTYGRRVTPDGVRHDRLDRIRQRQREAGMVYMKERSHKYGKAAGGASKHFAYPPRPDIRPTYWGPRVTPRVTV
jgi:hypothetical protein